MDRSQLQGVFEILYTLLNEIHIRLSIGQCVSQKDIIYLLSIWHQLIAPMTIVSVKDLLNHLKMKIFLEIFKASKDVCGF